MSENENSDGSGVSESELVDELMHKNDEKCCEDYEYEEELEKPKKKTQKKLTKEQKKIADYLRFKCPFKEGILKNIKVQYFIGSKMIDFLMESEWGPAPLHFNSSIKQLFENRKNCADYIHELMMIGLFIRCNKIYQTDPKEGNDKTESNSKTKKKFKLRFANDQYFDDDDESYVWFYKPTTMKNTLIGFGIIMGCILICCMPLWPSFILDIMRYLCYGFVGGLCLLLSMIVISHITYYTVLLLSFFRLKFWILPTLTDDVGFFESFVPLYSLEFRAKEKRN